MYLQCLGFTKRFAGFTAVDAVDLVVERGEFVTLLGPSGCGKTTLLRMIAGLLQPDAGSLRLDGRDLTQIPASARNFGFVFQAYALFPTKTVSENIEFPLRLRKTPAGQRRQRIAELADLVQIEDLLRRFPHELSGGQQQRVALARALAMEPPLLLLDEPLSALDARIRQRLRQELRLLVDRLGITALYVTHDQDEALELSDRIVVMEGGRIVQNDDPATLYHRPVNRYVAEFIGRTTLLPTVVGDDGSIKLAGTTVLARDAHDLAPRSRCLLSIRPQFVRLCAPGGGALLATLRQQVFTGPQVRASLQVHAVGELEAEVPYRQWRELNLSPGDVLGVELVNEEVVVLPEPKA